MGRTYFSLLLVLSFAVLATSFPQGLWNPYVKNSGSPVKKDNFYLITPYEDPEGYSGDGEEEGSGEGSTKIEFEDDEDLGSGIKPYLPKHGDPHIGFGIIPYTTVAPTPQHKVTPQESGNSDGDFWPNEEETTESTEARVDDEGVQAEENHKTDVPFWEMNFSGHWRNVGDVFNSFHSKTTKFFSNVSSDAKDLFNKARDSLYEFGLNINKGTQFMIDRMNQEMNKARSSQILQKLTDHLHAGNEAVAKFFQDIGSKIEKWRQGRNHEGVDDSFYDSLSKDQYEEGDIFQDPKIRQELNDLRGRNILTDEEVLALTRPEISEVNEIDYQKNKL